MQIVALSLPSLLRSWGGYHSGRGVGDCLPGAAADTLSICLDSTIVATLSRFSLPACWGQQPQIHIIALVCSVYFLSQKKGAGNAKMFFQRIAKTIELFFMGYGALPSNKQMEKVTQALKGLEDAEILEYLLCIWLLHRPHDLIELAHYFSGCFCASDFADGSLSFLFLVHVVAYYRSHKLRFMVFRA